jgi:hypothetical protein
MARIFMVIVAAGAVGSAALATTLGEVAPPNQAAPPQICKNVVSAALGAKPYKLCMTRAQWDAKKIADAKDANRIVCRYQEQIGTRFRSAKVCMPASDWENLRLADRQAVEHIQMQSCVPGAGC